jgi:NADH-quinone oxidoreductase subunit L
MENIQTVVESDLLRWIILFPLMGSLINGFLNRSKNHYLAGIIASLASGFAFLTTLYVLSQNGMNSAVQDSWFTWFEAGQLKVPFHLELTAVTCVMLLVVTGIGTLIHVYATSYMSHDESPWRFFTYLNLFLVAMLVLILSRSLVGVFLGWEGVGLCSYLLIGFWYKKDENTAAGMKAFVTNRIGDLGFLIALFVAIKYFRTTNIFEILSLNKQGLDSVPTAAWLVFAGGIFWASTGKSAQIPLYVWLPDAMAGPTPVSALIHAATMVTSGIFVIVRLWPVFASQQALLDVIFAIGVSTAWLAALIALKQDDIKKVLAYSTVSQLGFMFAALGVGAPAAALFHVVTHACFKALLFLGAGSVIHGMHEKQNMYEMGNLRSKMPVTHLTFLIGTLAIMGFPLTAGFFSKDLILEKAYAMNPLAYFFLLGAALLTAFYMLRAYTLTFWGQPRSEEAKKAHESSWIMTGPLCVLAVLSVSVGFLEIPDILGGVHLFEHWVDSSWRNFLPEQTGEHHAMAHWLEWCLMLVTTMGSLGLGFLSWKTFQKDSAFKKPQPDQTSFWTKLLEQKFYVDELYAILFLNPLRWVALKSSKIIDGILINGAAHFLRDSASFSGQIVSLFHTGNVQTYAWYLAFGTGIVVLLTWVTLT